MGQFFDLVEAINVEVAVYTDRCGLAPTEVSVSPTSYRRLLEMKMTELSPSFSTAGCTALRFVGVGDERMRIVIDETLDDTEVRVA